MGVGVRTTVRMDSCRVPGPWPAMEWRAQVRGGVANALPLAVEAPGGTSLPGGLEESGLLSGCRDRMAQWLGARALEPNWRSLGRALPLTCLMTLVKLQNFSLPQFPRLKVGTVMC